MLGQLFDDLNGLNRELMQRIEESRTWLDVDWSVNSRQDLNAIFNRVTEAAVLATGAETGYLLLIDERTDQLHLRAGRNLSPTQTKAFRTLTKDSLAETVVRFGKPILWSGNNGQHLALKMSYPVKSLLNVPLKVGTRVIGVLGVDNQVSNSRFTLTHLRRLSELADLVAATAIYMSQYFEIRQGRSRTSETNFNHSLAQPLALNNLEFTPAVVKPANVEQAKTEREHLSTLLEAMDNGVWMVDADLRLVAQNEAAGELLGWPAAEVVDRPISELTDSADDSSNRLAQLLNRAMEKQQRLSSDEGIWLTRQDAPPLLVKIKVVPVIYDNGIMTALCAFHPFEDNDYLKLEFANMASHLLRTPLSYIQTSVDLLLEADLEAEEQQQMLVKMREQCQQLRQFVKELLEMSHLDMGVVRVCPEPVALLPLFNQVLDLLRREEPDYQFKLAVSTTPPLVNADLSKTELILINLLRSGVRRCMAGGQLTIELEAHASEVIISVTDNGEAIPMAQLDRIFLPFYPVESSQGTMVCTYYLGLYTTKRLVELQNGRVWVESQPGQGSRFNFSLPIWEVNL